MAVVSLRSLLSLSHLRFSRVVEQTRPRDWNLTESEKNKKYACTVKHPLGTEHLWRITVLKDNPDSAIQNPATPRIHTIKTTRPVWKKDLQSRPHQIHVVDNLSGISQATRN